MVNSQPTKSSRKPYRIKIEFETRLKYAVTVDLDRLEICRLSHSSSFCPRCGFDIDIGPELAVTDLRYEPNWD